MLQDVIKNTHPPTLYLPHSFGLGSSQVRYLYRLTDLLTARFEHYLFGFGQIGNAIQTPLHVDVLGALLVGEKR